MAPKSKVQLEKDYLAWLVVSRPFSNQSLLFALISMFMYYLEDIKPGLLFLSFYTRICGHNYMIFNPLSQVFKVILWLDNRYMKFDWTRKMRRYLKTDESATQKFIKQLAYDASQILKKRSIFTEKMYWKRDQEIKCCVFQCLLIKYW